MNAAKVQYNKIKNLLNNPRDAFVVHWARQSDNDNQGGSNTPRIIGILTCNLDSSLTKTFDIHLEAEKNNFVSEDIEDFYDQLEFQILKDFNDFVNNHSNCTWIFWDSEGLLPEFEGLKHRYEVLIQENSEKSDTNKKSSILDIPINKRINLNKCLQKIYGVNYENSPQLDNLMKVNNKGQLKANFLTSKEEADEFKKLKFNKTLRSLKCKTDFFIEVIEKVESRKLKVSNKNLINRIGNIFMNPIMVAIAWLCTVAGFIIGIIALT